MPVISVPHPDLELGIARQPLHYAVCLPDGGLSPRTGVIFYIHGFGHSYDHPYTRSLLPYLANTHDCIAVAVGYHGAEAQTEMKLHVSPDFFANLQEYHGISVGMTAGMDVEAYFPVLLDHLAKTGLTELDSHCQLLKGPQGYINFGLLPALDHLQVAAEILRTYPVDKRRLFVLGTSYGGYVGLLLGKLAPNTFRLIIDNSGYSCAEDADGVIYGFTVWAGQVRICARSPIAFNHDPTSARYFSPARSQIRDIGVSEHYAMPSQTVFHSYHCVEDSVASTDIKIRTARVVGASRPYDLRLIGAADLDGRLFKHMGHGMDASMRRLFQLSHDRWVREAGVVADITDFDLKTVNTLPCADFDYVLRFDERGVGLSIC